MSLNFKNYNIFTIFQFNRSSYPLSAKLITSCVNLLILLLVEGLIPSLLSRISHACFHQRHILLNNKYVIIKYYFNHYQCGGMYTRRQDLRY